MNWLADRRRLVDALAALYLQRPELVARICDEDVDPTGRLLGIVRSEARNLRRLTVAG